MFALNCFQIPLHVQRVSVRRSGIYAYVSSVNSVAFTCSLKFKVLVGLYAQTLTSYVAPLPTYLSGLPSVPATLLNPDHDNTSILYRYVVYKRYSLIRYIFCINNFQIILIRVVILCRRTQDKAADTIRTFLCRITGTLLCTDLKILKVSS